MVDSSNGGREVLLMGPGPSCVPPIVRHALARPTRGHLDPYFVQVMDEIKEMLRKVMQTDNQVTFPVSGTGSAGMEASFANLVEEGDRVLVLANGVFGRRMADVAARHGAAVHTLESPWGSPVDVDAVRVNLAKQHYRVVAIVHAETSTGVCNPVEEIGRLVKPTGALYLVDAVTSLGGMPLATDRWGIDVLYGCSQKCLSCPPGLSPLSFSRRALDRLHARKSKVRSWYLDLSLLLGYWEGSNRVYHHTAPVNMLYGFHQALQCLLDEGLERVYSRHRAVEEQLVDELERLGLEIAVESGHRLPMLCIVRVPPGTDDAKARRALLDRYDIEIGAGLGPLAGRVWRIGLMGHTARPENIERLLDALENVLPGRARSGHGVAV